MNQETKKKITKLSRLQWIALVSEVIPVMFNRYGMSARVGDFSRAIHQMATMPENYINSNWGFFHEIEVAASEIVRVSRN